jgi:hypothetical protein
MHPKGIAVTAAGVLVGLYVWRTVARSMLGAVVGTKSNL